MISEYMEIEKLNDDGTVSLVKYSGTGKTYVKRVITGADPSLYRYLTTHPFYGIPDVKELFEADGELIVIEERVKGKSIEGNTYSEFEAMDIIASLCRILSPLHDNNIAHMNICASNVLVNFRGRPCLIGFDTTKPSDPAADIRALGSLLYQLATGYSPEDQSPEYSMTSSKFRTIVMNCLTNSYDDIKGLMEDLADSSIDIRLPGYRSSSIVKKTTATLWYLFILYFSFYVGVPDDFAGPSWFVSLTRLLLLALLTLYLGNYRGIRNRFPWRNQRSVGTAIAGAAIISLLLLAICSLILLAIA